MEQTLAELAQLFTDVSKPVFCVRVLPANFASILDWVHGERARQRIRPYRDYGCRCREGCRQRVCLFHSLSHYTAAHNPASVLVWMRQKKPSDQVRYPLSPFPFVTLTIRSFSPCSTQKEMDTILDSSHYSYHSRYSFGGDVRDAEVVHIPRAMGERTYN